MKKLYFLMLSAVVLAFVGCAKDPSSDGQLDVSDKSDDFVYLNLSMQLPLADGARSSTDWDDEENPGNGDTNSDADTDSEEGLDYENTVKSVLLVLANTEDRFITYAEVSGILKSGNSGRYIINAKFKRADIDKAYTDGILSSGTKVRMYAYVNYTSNLHNLFSNISESDITTKAWLNWSGEIVERPSRAGQSPIISNTIWAKHSFLMTNASIFTATFPATAGDWDQYASEKNPYEVMDANTAATGVIRVERAAARIDFKDASALGNNTYEIIGNVANSTDNQGLNLVNVQLTRMSLVNMSKNFYYLRRVSNGYDDKDVRICKNETRTNFVVDTDWTPKYTEKGITPENAADYFNFPVYGPEQHVDHYPYNRAGWYTDNISEVVKNTADNWNDKSYHIWRYVVENTLPDVNSQKTVQSTGVVFKGLIVPGKDIKAEITTEGEDNIRYLSDKVEKALIASIKHLPKSGTGKDAEGNIDYTSTNTPWSGENEADITDNMSYDYPTLYEFDGLIYAGFDEVVDRAVRDGQGSLLFAATQHILNHWVLDDNKFVHESKVANSETATKLSVRIFNEIRNGAEHVDDGSVDYTEGYTIELDEADEAFKTYATTFNDPEASNFTIYEVSYEDKDTENGEGWGYYCYYFYWNRHNDNNLNGKMGPMEFAIVRNNVYKLSVSKISRLGHPRNPDNDPDPYDPEDPDEEDRVYMTINLEVLPWVVRVNEIEF